MFPVQFTNFEEFFAWVFHKCFRNLCLKVAPDRESDINQIEFSHSCLSIQIVFFIKVYYYGKLAVKDPNLIASKHLFDNYIGTFDYIYMSKTHYFM